MTFTTVTVHYHYLSLSDTRVCDIGSLIKSVKNSLTKRNKKEESELKEFNELNEQQLYESLVLCFAKIHLIPLVKGILIFYQYAEKPEQKERQS